MEKLCDLPFQIIYILAFHYTHDAIILMHTRILQESLDMIYNAFIIMKGRHVMAKRNNKIAKNTALSKKQQGSEQIKNSS